MRFPVWLPHCCKFPWKSMKSRVLTFGPYNQHFLAAAYIYLTVKSCNQKIGTMTGFPLSARVLEDLVRGCLLRCIQEVHSGVFQLSKYNKHFPFLWQRDFLWQLHYYNADQYFHVRQTKLHWGCFHFISVIYQYFMKLEHILLNGWLRGNLLYWRVTWSDYTPNHNIQREITRSFCKGLLLSHFKMQYSDKRKSFQDQCGLVTFQESVDFTGYEIHASWSHQLQSLNGDHLWDRKRAPRR